MKGAVFLAAALLMSHPVLASETPHSLYADPRVRSVEYNPGQVYRIVGVFRSATEVIFGSDETIVNVAAGDSLSWEVVPRGYLLFIKPREHAGPTNLIVTTDHRGEFRNYAFELTSRAGPISAATPNTFFQVRFRYPQDERLAAARQHALDAALKFAELQQAAIRAALDQGVIEGARNLRYTVQGTSDLQPSEISDNGQFTVLRFPTTREIPSVYLVRSNGSETLVPFDVRGEFLVVHLVARQLRLRRNGEVLCIYNEAPVAYGKDHGTGTASPLVKRTTKEKS